MALRQNMERDGCREWKGWCSGEMNAGRGRAGAQERRMEGEEGLGLRSDGCRERKAGAQMSEISLLLRETPRASDSVIANCC
jgi:hypothetical protein